MFKQFLMVCIGVICAVNSFSQQEKNWGIDLNLSTQYQEYDLADASMQSFTFSPYYQFGNWMFSGSLPWMKMDGDYFINGNVPRIVSFCNWLQDASPLIVQRLISRNRITTQQVTRCERFISTIDELEEDQSGVGDAIVSARYLWQWGKYDAQWASLGIEYKHDNGNANNGIGSGSRDVSLNIGLGYEGTQWSSHVDTSFTRVSATKSVYDIQDYASFSVGAAYLFWKSLTLGLDYQFEEAYLAGDEDIKYFSAYFEWSLTSAAALRLTGNDYVDEPGYPQTEYGVELNFSF